MSEMNPVTIDPITLPSVPLAQRANLPTTSGIYFAIDNAGTIHYIGKAHNFCERWKHHHRYADLEGMDVNLFYLQSPIKGLVEVEKRFIQQFNPKLNKQRTGRTLVKTAKAEGLRRFSIRIAPWYYKRLIWRATNNNQAVSAAAENILATCIEENEDLIERMVADRAADLGISPDEMKKLWLEQAGYRP